MGACVGGDGGFVGREEGGQGGNCGVAEWDARWWPARESGAEVVGENRNEGGVEIMLGEVLFVVAKEDWCDGGKVIVTLREGPDGDVSREFGWLLKGHAEAIASIEDGSVGVVEGEVPRANVAKRWWSGGKSSAEWGEVGDGRVSSAEETLIIHGGEDVLVPKEGEVIIGEGGGRWGEVVDDVIKEDGDAAGLDGIVRGSDDGKVAGDGRGWGGVWN